MNMSGGKRWLALPLLLASLVAGTYLTYAAGPLDPTPIPPRSGGDSAPVEISVVVRPDGNWAGVARLSPGLLLLGMVEALEDHGIDYARETTLSADEQGRTIHLGGDDPHGIVEAALDVGCSDERLAGPVALSLHGFVRAGEVLSITLPGNPSTGYSWVMEASSEAALLQVEDVEAHQVSNGLGSPARQVLRLKAIGTGQAELRLAYWRSWENSPPVQVVSIRPDGLDLAETCEVLSLSLSPTTLDFGGRGEGEEPEQQVSLSSVQALPSAYNWCGTHGGCPSIRDQGACGSCWAFGTVGPLEAWIKYGDGIEAIDLSEQYLVSCNGNGWGCSGGWWAHSYHIEPGAVLESGFPYVASDVPCGGPYDHPYVISSWHYVGNGYSVPSVAAIKQAIYDHGPLAAAICVGSAFDNYSGGVFKTNETCDGEVNHAIVLVGWDDSQQVWILRNSWSSDWGEDGYMRIRYGTSNVGYSANYVVYAYTPFVAEAWVYLPLAMRGSQVAPPPSQGLANGDFEQGRSGSWSEYSSNGWTLILNTSEDLPVIPHGGEWAAWLGGDHDETSVLSQQVTIPSGATTLSYWYWISSEDACGFDYAYVEFGSTTLKAHNLCEDYDTGGWQYQQINVTGWRGQTVELRFVVETDEDFISNLFLDDVSISLIAAPAVSSTLPDPSVASLSHATALKSSR
jgi:predicted secreted protein